MIQNTSETLDSIKKTYTIPQLEAMVEALSENNDTNSSTKKVQDMDMINLMLTKKDLF